MRIGDIEILTAIDGECRNAPDRLYSGGPTPSAEDWAAHRADHDSSGRAIMSVGSYVMRIGDRIVLCDTGFGPRRLGAFHTGALQSHLLHLGVTPAEVTDVVYTHLHVDHVGWSNVDGESVFPNAEHWIDEREWQAYAEPDRCLAEWEMQMASVAFGSMREHFAPMRDRVRTFSPDTEIVPGVRALDAAGHSPGNTVFEIASRGERGYLIGDVAHTVGELLNDSWRLGFHFDHARAQEMIERYRALLLDTGAPFAAAHFPGMRWGTVSRANGALVYDVLDA